MSLNAPPTIAPAGIEGLDHILVGGFPRDRLYLVQGTPGTGKTTLALQYLLEGARAGERGIYVTLSETEEELRVAAASHGWSLDGITILELNSDEVSVGAESQYTLFHPSEIELSETTKRLLDAVEQIKPSRLVFDSLSEMRLLARDPLRYRRQILSLKQFFIGKRCTVLLLDDGSYEAGDPHVQSIAHGVLALEQSTSGYGTERRRLRVTKLRGVKFRGGYHDFTIEHEGLVVYPRLVGSEHRREPPNEQASTGVAELDAMLGGGLDRGTSTLLMGPAGAGKSSLAAQVVSAALERGERAAIFAFDETMSTLRARTEGLGLGLETREREGTLHLQQVDPAELAPGQFASLLKDAVERDGVRVLVIDSLNGYLNATPEERFLTVQLHELLGYLGQKGVITLLTVAQHGFIGGQVAAPVDVSYLADTVVLLRYFEARGEVRKALSVVKRRRGSHESTIREIRLGRGGMRVGGPIVEFQGVLTGAPTYLGGGSPLLDENDASRSA